ncbi:MAG: di-trans,poly-cis-decaprenylcistransferase [Parachlamydiales bacterium]|nr:di-trans,poly-cis-decaprenylcistransferase [Parachlamydiales bacterium]
MTAHTLELSEPKSVYSGEELSCIDLFKVPNHIAIIMDGNRRWAKQRGLPPMMGHLEGAETLTEILRGAAELGVKTLTVYTFSTENWRRPKDEVEDLMNIFELYLMRKKELMVRDGVRLNAIGDLSRLPERVLNAFHQTKKATEHCDRINLVLALNYGSRDEIRRAVVKIMNEKLEPEQITEECISRHLDTSPYGDPQLLIRTSGELRVSNFLLWQISYAEIFSSQVLWPDFSSKDLLKAVFAYQARNARLGV